MNILLGCLLGLCLSEELDLHRAARQSVRTLARHLHPDADLFKLETSVVKSPEVSMLDGAALSFVDAIELFFGVGRERDLLGAQVSLLDSARSGNNLASAMVAHCYSAGLLGFPLSHTLARDHLVDILDAWVKGVAWTNPYEYVPIQPLRNIRVGLGGEQDGLAPSEREYLFEDACNNPGSYQAHTVTTGYLTGTLGFEKDYVLASRFAALASAIDSDTTWYDISRANEIVTALGLTEDTNGTGRLTKYRHTLPLSNYAYLDAVLQVVYGAEELLFHEHGEVFGIPEDMTLREYLADPQVNIKTSSSTLISEALQLYLKYGARYTPGIRLRREALLKNVLAGVESYLESFTAKPILDRSTKETCTKRGQSFGILAWSLFGGYSLPEEYKGTTFVVQAARILYLMAAREGCHMGLSGLSFLALSRYSIDVDTYVVPSTSNPVVMESIVPYLEEYFVTPEALKTCPLPAPLAWFTRIEQLTTLPMKLPATMEAFMGLDVASISGGFEASFYLALLLSRSVGKYSPKPFGFHPHLWEPEVEMMLRHQQNCTLFKNCPNDSLDFYRGLPVDERMAVHLAMHSASAGNIGGEILTGAFIHEGLLGMTHTARGNAIWAKAARRISGKWLLLNSTRDYHSGDQERFLSLFISYFFNGLAGSRISLCNAVEMLLDDVKESRSKTIAFRRHPRHRIAPALRIVYDGEEYLGTQAIVHFATQLVLGMCPLADPACASLLKRLHVLDPHTVQGLLFGDLNVTADYPQLGLELFNLITANGSLYEQYVRHRLGLVPMARNSTSIMRLLGLLLPTEDSNSNGSSQSLTLLSTRLALWYQALSQRILQAEPTKLQMIISIVKRVISFHLRILAWALLKPLYYFIWPIYWLVRTLCHVLAWLASHLTSWIRYVTGRKKKVREEGATVLYTPTQALRPSRVRFQRGETPDPFALLMDICFSGPLLLQSPELLPAQAEAILSEILGVLPYCLDLQAILSTLHAHILTNLYLQSIDPMNPDEFLQQDIRRYLMGLDASAFSLLTSSHGSPLMKYLLNYLNRYVRRNSIAAGHEQPRRHCLQQHISRYAHLLKHSLKGAKIDMASLTESITTLLTYEASALQTLIETNAPCSTTPQLYPTREDVFDWDVLGVIDYTPPFTVVWTVHAILFAKQHARALLTCLVGAIAVLVWDRGN
ncbi:hypothetical protein GMRT_15507 [Giardia muris]|uniref:Uncharacterized protein n=1 Tax=Giardia muris TaxID=5742 RepID=A0A4Z1SVC1_GIAMU|nr:hypothetical protein GMRT_15507 [Giardia muris]|eukprot:TNJ29832.1 hypothetical protein GMRT_15507 [Giardia muris]